ncbi:uncharacterized protein L3040_001704 [Drepanopeziza brunnea f. sp. 'multigermtubi']|uniref:uncharacterized protein n=1 Tax=Drepanopeziza brunnea f. sp. 'multigermtubi' TaxID=698441 RepID=UPI002388C1EE|nr:hypothetical protein L3040_001704 [Drepanopeziza brunnea f. sp. 'multigermtubi']
MTTNPPPPGIPEIKLSYPTPSILLITINRPKDLNCMNSTMNHYLHALYTWPRLLRRRRPERVERLAREATFHKHKH